jgi:hypothetical protein
MREMEGLSYKELSGALAVSVPAVKSLLVRARIGLVEAIEARDTACCDIRTDIAAAFDKGVRASGRARRHLRECAPCREYRGALRGGLKELQSLGGGHGLLATAAKLLGLGGAGSGAAAGSSAAGGGAVAVGGGAVATKVAVIACCAAVVGGGAEAVHHAAAPTPASKARIVSKPAAVVPVLTPFSVPTRYVADPRVTVHRAVTPAAEKRGEPATGPAAPTPVDPALSDTLPASDSPVVDHANGGLLAPDEETDPAADPASGDGTAVPGTTGSPGATGTTQPGSGSSSSTPSTGSSTGTPGGSSPAQTGPGGGATGATPPTAQGATAPGSSPTPS